MTKQTTNVLVVAGALAFFAVLLLALSAVGRGQPASTAAAATAQSASAPPALPDASQPTQAQAPVPAPQTDPSKMTTTASGLQYIDQAVGTGAQPQAGQTVTVQYTGYLDNGKVFDSSVQRNQPFEFVLGAGQVIRGWDEGIASMKVGGKRRLIIPPQLAYGAQGAGGVIPPNARLTFDVELLGVK